MLAQFLDADRSAAAMQRACAARIAFGASEIGQHVPPAPAIATQSLPAVIVLRLAANVDHRVDEARAADAATTRLVAPPAAKSGLRQRFVGVVPLALEGNCTSASIRYWQAKEPFRDRDRLVGMTVLQVVSPEIRAGTAKGTERCWSSSQNRCSSDPIERTASRSDS